MADIPPGPVPLSLNPEEIPRELRFLNQWVDWMYVWKEGKDGNPGKWDKPLFNPQGRKASVTDSRTWSSFTDVKAAYEAGNYDGIGLVMLKKQDIPLQIVGFDFDRCRDPTTGEIDQKVRSQLDRLNSYSEISPSGTGIRVFARGDIPADGRRTKGIEIYKHAHYLTLTGHRLKEYASSIEARPEEISEIYNAHFSDTKTTVLAPGSERTPHPEMTDDQLICLASKARNSEKFMALMSGNIDGYLSQSEADLALCSILAFYTTSEMQIDRIFRRSGLYRDKWNEKRGRQTYGDGTIRKAITETNKHYSGPRPKGAPEISEDELNCYSLPEGPKFECNLPKEHFIQRFMTYGSDISDAYAEYWFASGLFALAVVADKKLKVSLKQGTVYPNLYISINGKSSLSRKSTVVDKTEAMLCQVLSELAPTLVPTEFSPEAFIEHLSDYNHAPWVRDEAAGVLSLMKRDYMRGFKDTLMQLYDSKPFHRRLRTSQRKGARTEFRVDDPYLNVLFATTDASLGANTEQNDTLTGFMARFLFFFPQGKKIKWLPLEEGTPVNSIFEEAVRGQLSGIADKISRIPECTALHFSPDAAAYYTEWQRVREEEWTASGDGNAMQIYSRLAPAVTKLAMLFELGAPDFDVNRPIRQEFMEEACRLVDSYFMPTARAIYELVGANAEKNVIDRIIAYLKKHNGKATKKEIMRDIKIKSADFDEYLATMVESGMVEVKAVKRGGKGRDSLYVFLLDNQKVGEVATIAKKAKIAKVEEIHSNKDNGDLEGKNSTLATLATKATSTILATDAEGGGDVLSVPNSMMVDLIRAEEQANAKDEHFKEVAGKFTKLRKRVIAFNMLADRGRFKKDEIVGIHVEGEFSVMPGICRKLECGECRTAIKGDLPLCKPCNWQRKSLGMAEA